jgi:hypothetical protein
LLPLRLIFLQANPPCAVETPIGVSVKEFLALSDLELVEGLERPCGGGYAHIWPAYLFMNDPVLGLSYSTCIILPHHWHPMRRRR